MSPSALITHGNDAQTSTQTDFECSWIATGYVRSAAQALAQETDCSMLHCADAWFNVIGGRCAFGATVDGLGGGGDDEVRTVVSELC